MNRETIKFIGILSFVAVFLIAVVIRHPSSNSTSKPTETPDSADIEPIPEEVAIDEPLDYVEVPTEISVEADPEDDDPNVSQPALSLADRMAIEEARRMTDGIKESIAHSKMLKEMGLRHIPVKGETIDLQRTDNVTEDEDGTPTVTVQIDEYQ
jgi:hypothetical protein